MEETLHPEVVARLEEVRRLKRELEKEEKELAGKVTAFFRNFHDPNDVSNKPATEVEYGEAVYQAVWDVQDRSKLNEDKLETYLVERGMWEELSEPTRKLNVEAFEQAVQEGILTPAELRENCMDIRVVRLVRVKQIN